jgi:TonB family protein
MTKKQKRNSIASVGTILFMGLVFLILWLMELTAYKAEQEETYIEITYGEDIEEPEVPETPIPEPTGAPSEETPAPAPIEHTVQEPVESAPIATTETSPLEIEQEPTPEVDTVAEKQEEFKKQTQNMMGGLFSAETPEPDNGNTTKNPVKGEKPGNNKPGHGSEGDNKWSLEGRAIVGQLPKPSNDFKQEGKIIIQISVDAAGNVTDAIVVGGDISDKATRQLAIDAAKKAKFSEDKSIKQQGTIEYKFRLN